jgi:hypothetical protein
MDKHPYIWVSVHTVEQYSALKRQQILTRHDMDVPWRRHCQSKKIVKNIVLFLSWKIPRIIKLIETESGKVAGNGYGDGYPTMEV